MSGLLTQEKLEEEWRYVTWDTTRGHRARRSIRGHIEAQEELWNKRWAEAVDRYETANLEAARLEAEVNRLREEADELHLLISQKDEQWNELLADRDRLQVALERIKEDKQIDVVRATSLGPAWVCAYCDYIVGHSEDCPTYIAYEALEGEE